MKKLLIFTLVVMGITSCSKDSFDSNADNLLSIDKSEMLVKVTYLTWSDLDSDLSCSGAGSHFINQLVNAKVELYNVAEPNSDHIGGIITSGLTDMDGIIIFRDLEPGQYILSVDTPYGQKTRTITTHLHKRASLEFSF